MKKDRIEIPHSWSPKLAEEFKTSQTTIRMALQYVNNSAKAIEIRKRALDLLSLESQKPQILN